jgi:hypothetical protein
LRCAGAVLLAACGSQSNAGFNGSGGGGGSSGGANGGDDASLGFAGGDDGGSGAFGGSGDGGAGGDSGALPPTTTFVDTCSTGAPSGLTPASVQALFAGGTVGSLRYLYPYAQTVFPRGLISPSLMWDGGSADFVYVHLKSKVFEYKGCLKPTAMGQVQLPQNIWDAAGSHASGASDPFALSLTLIASGKVTGPVTENIVIAPATLKGSIFYNSYTTKLLTNVGGPGGGGGAVLRIVPGQNATLFLGSSGCTGCHAVSADGTRMVADPFNPLNNGTGATYALTAQSTANPAPLVSSAPNATFVGVYPNGSLYLGNAHPLGGFGGPRPGGPLSTGPVNSALYETNTGNVVNNTGIPTGAMMPMFSPDGKLLAFNDLAISTGPDGGASGPEGFATMSFDVTSRTATNYKKVFQVTDTSKHPGWPFFLPDNGGLVFAIGSQADYSGNATGLNGAGAAATSDLYVLDLASGTSTLLAKAVGFNDASASATYLPFGSTDAANELHHNFYPTASPVAAGGYFWIFFDSYRHYGNLGLQRQLWGTALTVSSSGKYATDPSNPPFFVTGQELGTGNHRAFTALDPCHDDGANSPCTTGVDCCKGFCTNGTCGQPMPRCSNVDEKCDATNKCCDPTVPCISGFCAFVPR